LKKYGTGGYNGWDLWGSLDMGGRDEGIVLDGIYFSRF
jgi:hypothetical protein